MSNAPKNPVRIVTAASLFDGHDATINIIRRMLQDFGAEVIHLGHNRSVGDVVKAALQEGAQGICLSSYQGGHMEYFKYTRDLLDANGGEYVQIFGGGGGVIIHEEKKELEDYGIAQIFHPEDGRRLGLDGMIQMIIDGCDFDLLEALSKSKVKEGQYTDQELLKSHAIGIALSAVELGREIPESFKGKFLKQDSKKIPVCGITGTGGAGKSSLIDELSQRYLNAYEDKKIAIVCVDPSKRKTGGALLGDRIRMNSLSRNHAFMRSVASRGSGNEVAESLPKILNYLKSLDFDFIIAETSGIGQAASNITELSDFSTYVMTSEFGAQSQLEKIDMIDYAELIVINKADRRGAMDALHDVRKQYKRSHKAFMAEDESLPVFLCQASLFNDSGVNDLFFAMMNEVEKHGGSGFQIADSYKQALKDSVKQIIIPSERQNYLAEIVKSLRDYQTKTLANKAKISEWQALSETQKILGEDSKITDAIKERKAGLEAHEIDAMEKWDDLKKAYSGDEYSYFVRGKEIKQKLRVESLSHLKIPRVSFPKYSSWGDRYEFLRKENLPGFFPYTAGVFPLKREGEDPKRQFAGEGTPARTNRRFHYLSKDDDAKRLSTAFDSVTLYGEDPNPRPDIYGKVGESGVSICTLDDMKTLYSGFDLSAPNTSVSMTINGPAPMILAFYFNTAIDQNLEKKSKELGRDLKLEEVEEVKALTLQQVRGTVQADILKEDQAQNTCIFSLDFSLKMMGDIQEYFVKHSVRNFYSVSISGYHIAEAGANPISQLAFTLANGFTLVEYYLSRGMKIDDFAGNLSFFFSNGLDPEYTVIGRVARRIWAIAMRDLYGASERSQKLKYHIQTSGRSLHAQEIDFNDIRTTLQALLAINDNCNSLHTNAYDEAITTPTEESVRRAMAIQMIINKEFGLTKCENPNQGSFIVDELTDLVEEAVLNEFRRLNERGGVLGAMETQYQRSKIQEESLYYEHLKHSGDLPIIGVNTYQDPKTLEEGFVPPTIELARASREEKNHQLSALTDFQKSNSAEGNKALKELQLKAVRGENVFEALMQAARHCSLGQMSTALYEVGGQYRRNL
ncbi:MAG: fused isobutyryl-CoA mutase/GTPase IcmF [Bdellovibrionota bacterium]|nr:fused isobutyryl-CoA mutase/GTPase IcmF [Bdellovibrionota bacterium]